MWTHIYIIAPQTRAWVEAHGLVPTDGAIDAICDLIGAPLREVLSALAPYEPHGFVLKRRLARERRSWGFISHSSSSSAIVYNH
ncbi:UNVERIFIED_CONTAM: hypothetical protein Sangu_1486200 [Sesamum angustifolium]|uniref:Uncharacterized protein n=1 Tax=Sesamum angustifolium TaxID=2727405 RepID=A0AAW2MNV3_9LAMI